MVREVRGSEGLSSTLLRSRLLRPKLVGLAWLVGASAALAGGPPDAPRGESQLRAALVQTLEQQDVEGAMALYEPDAIFLSPGGRFSDRAAIRTLYRSVFLALHAKITMTSQRLVAEANLCVDDGTYSETLTEIANGKKTAVTGDYVLVARRGQDRSWKVAEIVWTQTSSTPL